MRTAAGGQQDGLFGELQKAASTHDDDDDDDDDDETRATALAEANKAYNNNSHWLSSSSSLSWSSPVFPPGEKEEDEETRHPYVASASSAEGGGGDGDGEGVGGEASNFVCYYDAASLYPSSGNARPLTPARRAGGARVAGPRGASAGPCGAGYRA